MRTRFSLFACVCSSRLLLLAAAVALCAGIVSAQVAPTSQFQLDGTAAHNGSYPACTYGPCDFWDLLNGAGGANPTGSAGSSIIRTFINGESSTLAFTGGGSKDPNDIPSWSCTNTPTPNKDTLTNGYAAGYSASGDVDLIFGADRLSVNGDANIGIWFFQQNVACNTATGKFSGVHMRGDIFVISAFTGGGTIPTITVFDWEPSCSAGVKNPTPGPLPGSCADTNLRVLFSAGSLCSPTSPFTSGTLSSLPACAITNTNNVAVSWPYPTSTSTVPSTVPTQALFTGGVDLSYLVTHFGGLASTPCIASFLEETRSSQTTSAVLKDFLGGNFPLCGLHITKTCGNGMNGAPAPTIIDNGTEIQYSWIGTVQNTGVGTLSNVAVNDLLAGAVVSGPTPTTITAKGTATDTATYTVTFVTSQLSATNSAKAQASFGSTVIVSDNTASATCNEAVSSSVKVTKHCAAPGLGDLTCSGSGCVVLVPYSANVCNNGDVQLTSITVTDHPNPGNEIGSIANNAFTLNPGDCTGGVQTAALCTTSADCTAGYSCNVAGHCATPPNPTGTYEPTGFDASSDGMTNGRFLFDDTVSVSSATPALGPHLTPVTGCPTGTDLACAPVSCPLCPQGECFLNPLP